MLALQYIQINSYFFSAIYNFRNTISYPCSLFHTNLYLQLFILSGIEHYLQTSFHIITFLIMHSQEDPLILFSNIFRAFYPNQSPSSSNNSTKANTISYSDKIQSINNLASTIHQNTDKLAIFCKEEAFKKKQVYPQANSSQIKQIRSLSFNQKGNKYFRSEQVPNYGKVNYLKTQSHLYIFNLAFIPEAWTNIVFILTESNIGFIFSYIQLCLHFNRFIKLFLPLNLWKKVRQVFEVVFTRNIFQIFANNKIVELFEDDKPSTFEFQGSIIIFFKNIWFWDSYNTYIILKGSKYVFKSPSISDQDSIYTMWRKNIINQQEYARVVDKTINTNVIWDSDQANICLIKQQCSHYITASMNHFQTFSQCQIFLSLPEDIVKEIFLEGQIFSSFQDQIIYKSFTAIDKLYIVLEGQAKLCPEDNKQAKNQKILHKSGFFSLKSIFCEVQHEKITLRVSSVESLIFSIPLWRFKFIIGHFLEDLRQIYEVDLESFAYPKELESFNISKWALKALLIDSQKCRNFSSSSTKMLKKCELKISKEIWYKICRQDIRCFFLATFENQL